MGELESAGMNPDLASRLDHALAVVRAGGDFALGHFRAGALAVERKGDGSPVTVADRGAERVMRERIAAAFPDDGIEGEEEAARPGTSGFTWILDPVDGTRSFTRGVPLWGTLVAVESAEAPGAPVIGVIHCPAARETVWAGRGLGAHHAGDGGPPRPARVSATRLADGLVSTTSARYLAHHTSMAAVERVFFAAKSVRGWSDCYQPGKRPCRDPRHPSKTPPSGRRTTRSSNAVRAEDVTSEVSAQPLAEGNCPLAPAARPRERYGSAIWTTSPQSASAIGGGFVRVVPPSGERVVRMGSERTLGCGLGLRWDPKE